MKGVILVFMGILLGFGSLPAQSLKVIYGDRLILISKGQIHVIKQLEKNSYFQGYDIVDSTHVFMAYIPHGFAEASTILAVYDMKTNLEYFITEIGGTGESFFHYNQENGLVMFNWISEVKRGSAIFSFKLELNPQGTKKEKLENFEPKVIFECQEDCFMPFWVDEKTISYQVWENDKITTKQYKVVF